MLGPRSDISAQRPQGRTPCALILFDTAPSICGDHYQEGLSLDDATLLYWGWLAQDPKHLEGMSEAERWERVLEGLRSKGEIPPYFQIDDIRSKARVIRGSLTGLSKYQLKPYAGRMVVLASQEGDYYQRTKEVSLGWAPLAAGKLESHFVPGEHRTMFQPPQVDVLAERLRELLR